MSHSFGGSHTEQKLDIVGDYLVRYTSALRRKDFTLWYIDVFAGTGSRDVEREVGFFDETTELTVKETLDGSVRRALKIDPPFHRFVFAEQDAERVAALDAVRQEYPDRNIIIENGEANAVLASPDFLRLWASDRSMHRGIVFLDPYALQVEWRTLVRLAETKKIDVWYLFPIRDVTRQLARDIKGIGPKYAKLDRVLGPEWRELYAPPIADQVSMFDEPVESSEVRTATKSQIEDWFRRRLASKFSFVAEPVPIKGDDGRQIFSLFLAIGNPSERATALAKHFAKEVRRRHETKAFRRRSAR